MSGDEFARYTLRYWKRKTTNELEKKEIAQEHLDRLALGVDKWNEWAIRLNQQPEALKNKSYYIINLSNIEIKQSDFIKYIFPCDVYFNNSTFKSKTEFNRATFNGIADFSDATFFAETYFMYATFLMGAGFGSAKFNNQATFNYSKFNYGVDFSGATFDENVNFGRVNFKMTASFMLSKFKKLANFNNSIFSTNAEFDYSQFEFIARFSGCTFKKSAKFENVIFKNTVIYDNSIFYEDAVFKVTKFNALILDGAKFQTSIPNFLYTKTETAVYLSEMALAQGLKPQKEDVLKYRRLKDMAIQAHDHQKELEFFGYELQAKCGGETTGSSALLISLFGWVSNFGQSIWRPAALIFFTWFISWIIVHASITNSEPPTYNKYEHNITCPVFGKELFSWSVIKYSMSYVTSNTLPISTSTKEEKRNINYCLFGGDVRPMKYKILAMVQLVISLIGFFLLGLGIRNRFKIK